MTTETLCWTEPRRNVGDFQLEDPLAFSVLEAQIANLLFPGFTRHSTQPAYYVMVCYGLLISETVAQRYGLTPSDDTIRDVFHRWERLWAMAVCVARDGNLASEVGMRGKEGALAAFQAQRGGFLLDYQLIAHRRELSALGAYLTSLRDHGLVREDRLRLTPLGWDLAQWMWRAPSAEIEPHEDVLVDLLRPGQTAAIKPHTRKALVELGERGSLGAIMQRPFLKDVLFRRLFESSGPRFSILSETTKLLIDATRRDGAEDARTFIDSIARSPMTSSKLRDLATLALVFGDLGMTLRTIFDRMYQAVLARGYASAWSECVHAAIPSGFASVLNTHISNWRGFARAEAMLSPLAYGAKFVQVVRRMNAQNAYHIFESILHLHVQMQRIRGKAAWIDRKGEVVYLRQAGYDSWAMEGSDWAPGYRIAMIQQLIRDLGHLP